MSLKIDAAAYSHIGVRANNEDNFYFNGVFMSREQMNQGGQVAASCTDKSQIYAVCDGMGGAEFGEEASLLTVTELRAYQKECPQPDNTQHLNDMIDAVSRKVDAIATGKGMISGSCGSTIAMLLIDDYYYRVVHVGDSRIYRLRGGKLTRLMKDDSEVQRMVDNGQITQEQAFMHPRSNVISRHLGMPIPEGKTLKPTIGARSDLVAGDRYLLCSDGLSDVMRDSLIEKVLAGGTPKEAARALVHKALEEAKGYGINSDNVTVVVLDAVDVGKRENAIRRVQKLRALQLLSGVTGLCSLGGIVWCLMQLLKR